MKTLLLLAIGIFCGFFTYAQQAQVLGTIKEESTATPIAFATVVLKDTTLNIIATGITNETGAFKIDKLPAGNLSISYSFIGFQTKTESVQLSSEEILKLGTILLKPNLQQLKEVNVTAGRTSVSLKLDRKVFEVGKDVLSQSGTVTDLLNIVPSVSVSPSGAISLRGNSNVLVLINGRRTGLTQGSALEQVPADQVERVEVITNPSSKYDAAGSAGIINIVLKKNRKAGLNGQLRLVGGTPNETRISPSLSYKINKLNLFATYGLRISDFVGLYTMQQSSGLTATPRYLDQRQDENRHDDGRLLYFGADYQLNDRNLFTAAFLRNATNDHDKTQLGYLYSGKGGGLDSSLNRTGESWEKRSYNQLEFNYTRNFKRAGKRWSVDLQYDFWDSDKDWNLATQKLLPLPFALPLIRTGSTGSTKDLMIKTDMQQPLDSNATLEFGLKMESRRVGSNFIAQQQFGSGWQVIERIDNHLLYKELIGGAYAQLAGKLGKFGYQAGVRGEITNIGIKDRMGSYSNQKNYIRPFPTLNVNYRFGTGAAIQGSYSKRINRPQLNLIYPFNELTDLTTRFIGNPDLNPTYADVLELGFLKSWTTLTFNPSVYYQHNNGVIEEYTYQNAGRLFITMPVNISTEVRKGVELSVLYHPAKWLQLNTELNAYSFYQRGVYSTQNFNFSGRTLTARVNTQLKFASKLAFQVIYNFRGANATAQTRSAAVHAIDLGASKNFLKDKATLMFDVSNLSALRKFNNTTTGAGYRFTQVNLPNAARYRLTLVYRLNLKDNQTVRQAKSGNRN